MGDQGKGFDTRVIHDGEPRPRLMGSAVVPIFQSTVYEVSGDPDYHQIPYIRLNNLPNHTVLGDKLAALEGAEAGLVTASGMAAITTTLLALFSAGDHLLVHGCLYGGTHSFVHSHLARFGVTVSVIDATDASCWSAALRPQTRGIYVETLSNPLLEVADLPAVVDFARAQGLVSLIDNTFASPVNCRPPSLGFDLSLHSATKYLNGHSDLVAGAVLGGREHVDQVRHTLDHLGGCLDPHAAYMLHRGVRTLGLRVRHQNQSAQVIAEWLEARPEVVAVHYPGLESHPHHQRAKTLLDGGGGVLSFILSGDADRAQRVVDGTQLWLPGPSLGGVESLITRPAATSHRGMSATDRQAAGIGDALIRLAVGIEDPPDLIADLDRAIEAA